VKQEKDEKKPKRPPTAFMLYLNANRDKIKSENPGIAVTDIAKKGGEMWRDLKDKSVCVSCASIYSVTSQPVIAHIS
jgi:structure-specific recognition protein 1